MPSQLEICNVALSRLGAKPITSFTDNTNEQITVSNVWNVVRQATLRDHSWNFAIADIELAAIYGYVQFDFKYAYQTPVDCIRLIELYEGAEYKLQGGKILTDSQSCRIRYVKDETDPIRWDASFVDAIAWRLAADTAFALSNNQSTAEFCTNMYMRALKNARHIDATEEVLDPIGGDRSVLLSTRY